MRRHELTARLPYSRLERLQLAARVAFILAAIFAVVMALLPRPPDITDLPDSMNHMLAFATLGLLAGVGFGSRSVVWLFVLLTLLGGAIEVAQAIPVLNRDSQWSDLMADMAAALPALIVGRLAIAWLRRTRFGAGG